MWLSACLRKQWKKKKRKALKNYEKHRNMIAFVLSRTGSNSWKLKHQFKCGEMSDVLMGVFIKISSVYIFLIYSLR